MAQALLGAAASSLQPAPQPPQGPLVNNPLEFIHIPKTGGEAIEVRLSSCTATSIVLARH